MIHREISKVTALDIYRAVVFGLMGPFFGFVIFFMFV
jgi:hypothetical protein